VKYTSLQLEIQETQRQIKEVVAIQADAVWKRISALSRTLFEAEDRYREIGSQYYSKGWFGMALYMNISPQSYSDVAEALHGNDKHRGFLQPWRDLGKSLQVAVRYLNAGTPGCAYRECYKAYTFAKAISRSLLGLQGLVRSVQSWGSFANALVPRHGEEDPLERRNDAM
jgi:hypothetical protein